jgi:hypothetical protein
MNVHWKTLEIIVTVLHMVFKWTTSVLPCFAKSHHVRAAFDFSSSNLPSRLASRNQDMLHV